MALLQLSQVTKDFGGLKALEAVSTHVNQGEIVSLIGPNGAGKTTLFNCITGTMPPSSGAITFDGDELVGKSPHEVVQRGIARTFQHIRLFNDISVCCRGWIRCRKCCPMPIAGDWKSPGRWPPNPGCCFWTNPRPA